MDNPYIDESMTEAYVYETEQIIENLEQLMIQSEKEGDFTTDSINEIFRFMHTIKGCSAMMMFNEIATLAHRIEDLFYVIRENRDVSYDFTSLVDVVLESIDFFKIELMKIKQKEPLDGEAKELLERVDVLVTAMKSKTDKNQNVMDSEIVEKDSVIEASMTEESDTEYVKPNTDLIGASYYFATVKFKADSEMENIRAYTIIRNMEDLISQVFYKPNKLLEDDSSVEEIRKEGFLILIQSRKESKFISEYLESTIFLDTLEFEEIAVDTYVDMANMMQNRTSVAVDTTDALPGAVEKQESVKLEDEKADMVTVMQESSTLETATGIVVAKEKNENVPKKDKQESSNGTSQGIISVNVDKLDKLMDMVGELVIAEAMVSQNPEVTKLEIESFEKASRQLHKISTELQDMVMAIRMVPLSTTFMKMHRIVRDMAKKLNKSVVLDVFGEETEVDKNIIEKISDPLMHIIRNSLDHGIEDETTRLEAGKEKQGTIILEAKNSGSDVLIIIKDDGKGLNKEVIYKKAMAQGLVFRPIEEMSEREVFRLILSPGFSTKEEVTEFSGRGVGMDVVAKNIESIGGAVIVDSEPMHGTTIILKIPLTLAIIEGMNIRVGNARFTLPIVSIKQSFRPKKKEIIKDTEGMEMIMVRGLCYPIIRLHELFEVDSGLKDMEDGILIMVEEDEKSCCLFADELLGQQQIVVKSLPNYIKKLRQISGIGGCTLLGDGNISLILDVGAFNLSRVYDKFE